MPDTAEFLQDVAKGLDKIFNGEARGANRQTGFVLLAFPFNAERGARTNYVSNAQREDIIVALKEIVARFEGRAADTDTVQ